MGFDERWRRRLGKASAPVEPRKPRTDAEIQQAAQEAQERHNNAVAQLADTPYADLVREHLRTAVERLATSRGARQRAEATFDEFLASGLDASTALGEQMEAIDAEADALGYLDTLIDEVDLRSRDATAEATAAAIRAELGDGLYSVRAVSVESDTVLPGEPWFGSDSFLRATLIALIGHLPAESFDMPTRLQHLGAQELVDGIDLQPAVMLKGHLLQGGVRADIKEGRRASATPRREPIPEKVRHEVWRRDEGKCVDCGSRERLEFDHIVPLSKGGSNTARNLELRCESCNRRKGATI